MLRWFEKKKDILEFLGKDGKNVRYLARQLEKWWIMCENWRYCFTRDYDRHHFEERIKELEEENKGLKEENKKLRDILGGIVFGIDVIRLN